MTDILPIRFFGIAHDQGLSVLLNEICTDPDVLPMIRRILEAGHRIALANHRGRRRVVIVETYPDHGRAQGGDTLREALNKALRVLDEAQGDRDA